MHVHVLRLGHRKRRDKRITTHVCLTARAFGAEHVYLSGEYDEVVIESVRKVVEKWGGPFTLEYVRDWRSLLKRFPGRKVHLTMYGLPHIEILPKIKDERVLLIVGAEKVPKEVYELSDYNVAIGNQPHSEVAALAIALYELLGPKALYRDFSDAKLKILPCERGKMVLNLNSLGSNENREKEKE